MEGIINTVEKLLSSNMYPELSALLIGLAVALNPCQLAINISALTYISKDNADGKTLVSKGIIYAAGRTVTYIAMAWILLMVLKMSGFGISLTQSILSKAEIILPPVLIAVGIFLIFRALHTHKHSDECHNCGNIIRSSGSRGTFVLGMMLALAFCPESGLFYFGMMLPLSAASENSWLIPVCFAVAASVPVMVLSVLISGAMSKARSFENRFKHFQQWLNGIVGVIFIVIAVLILSE